MGLFLFIFKPGAIWLHLDDTYDENMIRPKTFGEWVQSLDVADERRHVLSPVRALRTFVNFVKGSSHFHALCLTRAHFDTYNFKEKNLLGSKYNVFSMYDKCINVKIKRWQSAKSFWRSLPTNASISLSKFYNSILYSNKLGLCVNRFKTKNISIVGVLKFFHFVHFH